MDVEKLIVDNGGILDNKTAEEHGILRGVLAKLCKEGQLVRVARGQYGLPDSLADELLSLDKRSQYLIFSHETALFLHGISDRTPFVHTMTCPSGRVPSRAMAEECKIYFIKPALFQLGLCQKTTPGGNLVNCYDLERTICDIVRNRNTMGTETFLAALKLYSSSGEKNLNRLYDYSKKMGLSNVLQSYLEVLL